MEPDPSDPPIVDVHFAGPDADSLATFLRELVDARLIASGYVLPGVRSIYRMGTVYEDNVALAVVQTREALAQKVMDRAGHRFAQPEAAPRRYSTVSDFSCHRWVIDSTDPTLA